MRMKDNEKIGPGVTEHAQRVLTKKVLRAEAKMKKPKFVTEIEVGRSELQNSVTIHINGQAFVMGRAATLCLAKKLQDITNDWAFRYVSGSDVGEVT